MVNLTLYTKTTAPEDSRPILEMVAQRFGFVPNVLAQIAEEPAALKATVQLLALLDESSLSVDEQYIVLLTVAYENVSNYCVAANSTVAQASKVQPDIIASVRQGGPLTDPKLEVLRAFTAEMVRERGNVSAATTKLFFDTGYTKAQLFGVILGVATETLASYTDRVSGVPMDDQFRAFTWDRPKPPASSS